MAQHAEPNVRQDLFSEIPWVATVYLPRRDAKEPNVTEAKKTNVLGFLKNLVVDEVPEPAAPAATRPSSTPAPARPAATSFSSTPPSAAADPAILSTLEKKLQNNCPQPYAAFMEQYEALADIIPDETMRFKAALKASHTTAEDLVKALDQLIHTMDTAEEEFARTFQENKAKRLGDAEKSIKATDDLITSNEQQIKSIQDTITSLRTKRDTDAGTMEHEVQKFEGIRSGFEAAHGQVVGRLTAQKNRVSAMKV